ncbi:MAG: 16S rRNA (guanine(966)-N(2))-methyltransferase RsmD [Bacteroidota bacterium]
MRIISGSFKGKQITPPKRFQGRPTTDFARESIFNVLNNHYDLDQIRFLDLFSGSGAFTYEMGSRGCEDITSVEIDAMQTDFIKRNIEEMQMDGISVLNSNAISFLERVQKEYHIIFADPPFDSEEYREIHQLVFERKLLRPGGLLVLEHSKKHDFSELQHFLEHRKYGAVNFSIFEQPAEN